MSVLTFTLITHLLYFSPVQIFWYTLHYFLQIIRTEKSVEIKIAPLYVCTVLYVEYVIGRETIPKSNVRQSWRSIIIK